MSTGKRARELSEDESSDDQTKKPKTKNMVDADKKKDDERSTWKLAIDFSDVRGLHNTRSDEFWEKTFLDDPVDALRTKLNQMEVVALANFIGHKRSTSKVNRALSEAAESFIAPAALPRTQLGIDFDIISDPVRAIVRYQQTVVDLLKIRDSVASVEERFKLMSERLEKRWNKAIKKRVDKVTASEISDL